MNYWKNIAFIFLLIGIISCDKESDDDLIEYPIKYKTSSISKSKIKVFTKDGEVTQANSKDKFIEKYRYLLTDLKTFNVKEKMIATYLSKDTVEIVWNGMMYHNNKRRIYEDNNLIYWEQPDTSYFPIVVNSVSNVRKYYKYKPLYYVEHDLPATSGVYKQGICKNCNYILKEKGKLQMPMLDFVLKQADKSAIHINVNNQFDDSHLSTIGLNDTIMIQEYMIKLK